MREIMFRGKRADNGEWITHSETYIRDGDGVWLSDQDRHVEKVIPETVGQFTGRTDKNGVEIFKGDIVKINNSKANAYVDFVEFSWQCLIPEYPYYRHRLENISDKYEVIGNIYDNPELLGDENHGPKESN